MKNDAACFITTDVLKAYTSRSSVGRHMGIELPVGSEETAEAVVVVDCATVGFGIGLGRAMDDEGFLSARAAGVLFTVPHAQGRSKREIAATASLRCRISQRPRAG